MNKKKILQVVLSIVGSVIMFVMGFSFYKCYFNGWPIVKKICIGRNGGDISYVKGDYWTSNGDNTCTITYKQGDNMISYLVNLNTKTAKLISNNSLSKTTKYEAIF